MIGRIKREGIAGMKRAQRLNRQQRRNLAFGPVLAPDRRNLAFVSRLAPDVTPPPIDEGCKVIGPCSLPEGQPDVAFLRWFAHRIACSTSDESEREGLSVREYGIDMLGQLLESMADDTAHVVTRETDGALLLVIDRNRLLRSDDDLENFLAEFSELPARQITSEELVGVDQMFRAAASSPIRSNVSSGVSAPAASAQSPGLRKAPAGGKTVFAA